MKRINTFLLCAGATAYFHIATAPSAFAAPILAADLASFAVLGHTTVTNVPTSTVFGNVGVAPGTSITGFNSVSGIAVADSQVTGGLVHSNTPIANSAQAQLTTARSNLSSLGAGTVLGADLSGLTLAPGVYTVAAGTTNLTGTLTLNGFGNANALWVFQMPSTLITSSSSVVNVINTGAGAGVFWNVGSSATLGTTTSFQGNILALTSIALNTGATIGCGRALADNGAVTMDQNTVSIGCASNGFAGNALAFTPTPPIGGGPGGGIITDGGTVVSVPGTVVPEPGTLVLLGSGIAGLLAARRRPSARGRQRNLTLAGVA